MQELKAEAAARDQLLERLHRIEAERDRYTVHKRETDVLRARVQELEDKIQRQEAYLRSRLLKDKTNTLPPAPAPPSDPSTSKTVVNRRNSTSKLAPSSSYSTQAASHSESLSSTSFSIRPGADLGAGAGASSAGSSVNGIYEDPSGKSGGGGDGRAGFDGTGGVNAHFLQGGDSRGAPDAGGARRSVGPGARRVDRVI